MAYLTAAEVVTEGIPIGFSWPSALTEDQKTAIVADAQERIEQVTNEKWEETSSISHLVSGDGTDLLELKRVTSWPLVSITQIQHRSTYANSDDFDANGTIVDADDYSISPSKRSILRVKPTTIRGGLSGLGPIWLQGHKNYKVTGTFGHVTTPEGIKRATARMAMEIAEPGVTDQLTGVVSETHPDGYKYVTAAGIKTGIGGVVPLLTGIYAVDMLLKDYARKMPIMVVPR